MKKNEEAVPIKDIQEENEIGVSEMKIWVTGN